MLVALLAVAHEAAADEVLADGKAAEHLGHNVIKGGAATEVFAAVGALIVPGEVDLITRRASGDEAGFVNVCFVHRDRAAGAMPRLKGQGCRRRCRCAL